MKPTTSPAHDPRLALPFGRVATLALLSWAAAWAPFEARAYVETPPFRWAAGFTRISTLGQYYSSTGNLTDNRGEFQSLPNQGSFTETSGRLRGRYNLTDDMALYAQTNFAQVQAKSALLGTKQNATVTDAALGFNLVLLDSSWRLVGEVEGNFAVDQVKYDRTDALGSDGVHYGKVAVYAMKPFSWVNLVASLGAKVRAEGMAAQAVWSLALEKPLLRKFLIGAGFNGYESVVSDQLYPRDRRVVTDLANAGSLRHYSFNDALIEGGVWLGWAPVPALQARFGYEQGVTGQRAAIGSAFFLALSFSLEPNPSMDSFGTEAYAREREREERKGRGEAKGFKVQEERTDDSLFYDEVPRDARKKRPRPQPETQNPYRKSAPPSGGNPLDATEQTLEP